LLPFLVLALVLLGRRPAKAEDSLSTKFEHYAETDGRVKVVAYYAQAEVAVSPEWAFQFTGLVDSISGASPNGLLPENAEEPLPLSELPGEERVSGVVDALFEKGRVTGLLEYSYSDEPDYLSRGVATQWTLDFNQRQTTVRAGVSHLNDTVIRSRLENDRRAYDALIGVTQVVDARTTVTFNLGYGWNTGYLSDPYKVIGWTQITTIPLPGGLPPVVVEQQVAAEENRPSLRRRYVAYLAGQRFFDRANGSVDASLRYFHDSWGIDGWTAEISWLQKLGEQFVLQPIFRYNQQTAADFYLLSLDEIGFVPAALPTARAPYYSADYRLSALRSTTVGLKAVWFLGDHLTFDAAYEYYAMDGTDGRTLPEAYPSAHIITLGARYEF
jgi:hypothetical protein